MRKRKAYPRISGETPPHKGEYSNEICPFEFNDPTFRCEIGWDRCAEPKYLKTCPKWNSDKT